MIHSTKKLKIDSRYDLHFENYEWGEIAKRTFLSY